MSKRPIIEPFRIKSVEPFLGDDSEFLLTYGDGVGDIDIPAVLDYHHSHGKALTLTAVRPPGRFGELGLTPDSKVAEFNEKAQTEGGWINGGFFVASKWL